VSNIRDIPYKDEISDTKFTLDFYLTVIKIVLTVENKSPRNEGRQQPLNDNKQNKVKDRIKFLFYNVLYDCSVKPINSQ
jgi:hypothetical protein